MAFFANILTYSFRVLMTRIKSQTSAKHGPNICRCPGDGRSKLPPSDDVYEANTLASGEARLFALMIELTSVNAIA